MSQQRGGAASKLVRTTVMVPEQMDAEMRRLAEEHGRPLAWELRRALQAHIDRENDRKAA
jgi:predicted transcriptional regulator